MSDSAKLALARSIYSDWERGEFGLLGWADAQIEFVVADGPEPLDARGLRATLQRWFEFVSAGAGYRIVGEQFRELDSERVLVLMRTGDARGGGGGAQDARGSGRAGVQVFSIRAGRVTRLVTYLDRSRGLTELGLAAQADRHG